MPPGVRHRGGAKRQRLLFQKSPPSTVLPHLLQCSNRLNWPDGAESKKSLKAVQASEGVHLVHHVLCCGVV